LKTRDEEGCGRADDNLLKKCVSFTGRAFIISGQKMAPVMNPVFNRKRMDEKAAEWR
jgi:hypothetical protein